MKPKKPRLKVGDRRVTFTGRINYAHKPKLFDLFRVIRIVDHLFVRDDPKACTDASIKFLQYRFSDWLHLRGIVQQELRKGALASRVARVDAELYGSESWEAEYVKFIEWFDGVVKVIDAGMAYVTDLVPELAPAIKFLGGTTELYKYVREHFPIK